tara:strand:- start:3342 stop:3575 length:234 start_codon:yes stop_codon:yes gene_type:complete
MKGIKKNMTTAQRIAIIKRHAEKFNKKIQKSHRANTQYQDRYDNGGNINSWTDESKYAEQYYGERMRQTTWHDDDWG